MNKLVSKDEAFTTFIFRFVFLFEPESDFLSLLMAPVANTPNQTVILIEVSFNIAAIHIAIVAQVIVLGESMPKTGGS